MPWGPGRVDDAGRSTNHPASPESGVLGVGGIKHCARLALTSASRLTQPLKSCCHSSVLHAPPGACNGPADAADGVATAHAMEATAITSTVNTIAHARRVISTLPVGQLRNGRRRLHPGRRGVQVLEQAVDVRDVDPHLLHPAVDVAHHELAEA